MKKYFKPILSVFLIVVITFLITRIFYHNFIFNNNMPDKNTEIIKSDDLINDDSNLGSNNDNNDKDNENNVDNTEVVNIENAKKEDAPPKEEPKNNNSNTNSSSKVDSKEHPKVETPQKEDIISKEENAWDSLGITEYDYYHKPVWSWARIDYSIEKYKTQENARNACIAEGNRLTREEHIKSGFSCLNVLSYAGNYLGEMLNTF